MPTLEEALDIFGQVINGPWRGWLMAALGLAFVGGVITRVLWGGRRD